MNKKNLVKMLEYYLILLRVYKVYILLFFNILFGQFASNVVNIDIISDTKKGESIYRTKDGKTVFVADENKNINDSEEAVYKAPVSTDRKKELEDQIKQQEEEIEIEELEKKLEELKKKRKK